MSSAKSAHVLLCFTQKASSQEGNERNKEPWKMVKSEIKREILTSLNAISMSFWAFKLYNEWSRSDTLLKGIKKAQRGKKRTKEKKKKKTRRISYQPSIKHLENVISIFFFPQLYDRFFDNFSDFKCFDNVNLHILLFLPFLSLVKTFFSFISFDVFIRMLVLCQKNGWYAFLAGYLSAWSIWRSLRCLFIRSSQASSYSSWVYRWNPLQFDYFEISHLDVKPFLNSLEWLRKKKKAAKRF